MSHSSGAVAGIFTEGTAIASFLPTLRQVFGARAVIEIGARELRDPMALGGFDLLVLPGVSSETSHYPQVMDARAQGAVLSAVRGGMNLWTSCASSYFFSKSYSYSSPSKTVTGRVGLGVFEGSAWGPVDGNPPDAPERSRFSDTRVLKVAFNDNAGKAVEAGICYSNGPAYIPAPGEDIDIIARYAGVAGNPVAAAAKTVGKGVVIFSGVLPEMSAAEMIIDPAEQQKFPHLVNLCRESLKYEAERQALVGVFMRKFGL